MIFDFFPQNNLKLEKGFTVKPKLLGLRDQRLDVPSEAQQWPERFNKSSQ